MSLPFGLKPIGKAVACLMCGGSMDVGKTIDYRRHCDYAWCAECDFAQIYPMPSEEEVLDYYTSGQYRKDSHGDREGLPDEHNFSEERQSPEGWLPHISLPVERHLDIGASTGATLEIIGAGTRVGVEPGPWGRSWGALENLDEVEGTFDLITAIHVLEHVIDPFEMLRKIRLLAVGQVCIELPKPPGWGWPHLTCFRNKSILKAMADAEMPATIVDDVYDIKVKHETNL